MDKLFVLDYLSPCFIKLGVVRLCIFCVVMQFLYLSRMKTNSSCISNIANFNAHLDFRGMQVFLCGFTGKKCCIYHLLVYI